MNHGRVTDLFDELEDQFRAHDVVRDLNTETSESVNLMIYDFSGVLRIEQRRVSRRDLWVGSEENFQ